jgi:excinuclease ABC subunit C
MIPNPIEQKLDLLPKTPGCYLFKNNQGVVIYIGKARVLRQRVRQYFQDPKHLDAKTVVMVAKIHDFEIIETDSEVEALILESNLVKQYRPRYNINLKDDKSFPYIKVTDELFPRIFVTREKERTGGKYFGPYTDVRTLRFNLKTLHEIFPIRSCSHRFTEEMIEQKKVKLCLDYHIKKCEGPCQALISISQYRYMTDQMVQFINGKTTGLLNELKSDMERLAGGMRFEEAAKIRDRILAIERYDSNQKVVFPDHKDKDIAAVARADDDACGVIFKIRDGKIIGRQHFYFNRVEDKPSEEVLESLIKTCYSKADYIPPEILMPYDPSETDLLITWLSRKHPVTMQVPQDDASVKLMAMCTRNAELLLGELKLQKAKARESAIPKVLSLLQKDLHLPAIPRRIECFDNSNIQGHEPVASMVVFIDGRPKSGEYRKFKIKTVQGPDDFASMYEIISRRYLRVMAEGLDWPDLIIVDGGKGQLSSAVQALQDIGVTVKDVDQDGYVIIGLAKKREEIFLPGLSDPIMIPKTSPSLKLLQNIRNEAHRFAITYHRRLRRKNSIQSALDDVKGIGPKKRNALIRQFGSIQNIITARIEDIAKTANIPESRAIELQNILKQSIPDEPIKEQNQ